LYHQYLHATACYSAYMLSPVHLSVTRVDWSKTVEARIMQYSPHRSHIPLVFWDKFYLDTLMDPPSRGVKQGWGGKNKLFSNFMRQYFVCGRRYVQGCY